MVFRNWRRANEEEDQSLFEESETCVGSGGLSDHQKHRARSLHDHPLVDRPGKPKSRRQVDQQVKSSSYSPLSIPAMIPCIPLSFIQSY